MFSFRLFPLVLFILLNFMTFAQGKLQVRVINSSTKAPVEFANLRLFNSKDSTVVSGAYSDSKGLIVVEQIPVGEYYAQVKSFGFETYTVNGISITLKKLKVNLKDIYLKEVKTQELDEVTVRAEKEVMTTSFDKKVYNLSEDVTTQGGEATDILNNIPSVEVDNDGNVSLRGSGNVTILIDGRPSAMTGGAEGVLDGIPAGSIERIELVTNPSAKYDPDGTAGIINIVLKKDKLRGANATVNMTAATGHIYNTGISANLRREKYNVFANYAVRYREGYRNNMNDRTSSINDTLVNLFQDRSGTDTRLSHTAKFGSDFYLSENQVIGIAASGSYNTRVRTGNQWNRVSYDNTPDRYWNRVTEDPRERMNVDINADYKVDLKDQSGEFLAVLTQSIGSSSSTGEYRENYYRPDGSDLFSDELYQFQSGENDQNTFTGSADFSKKINDSMRYELGTKVILNSQYRSNYLEYFDSIQDAILPDINVINEFVFDEDIYSLYGIFAHQINRFRYQGGVRLEQAFTQPQLLTTNEDFENNYFSFFPSAHLVYGDEKMGEFSLSYSRRINRPRSWTLNPFPIYSDPLNLRRGNPSLQPEYINSYELGYQKKWSKITLTNSIYYRHTIDKIQRIRQFFPDGVSINGFANIAESHDLGLEVIAAYSPFSWWKNTVSFNGYQTRLNANVDGVQLSNNGFSWNLKVNSTFNLFKGTTSIQVNAQYIAPTFTVQGYYQRYPGIDIGVNRHFLNKKLSVGLRFSDIMDDQGFYLLVSDGVFTQESMYKWETRRIFLSASYKFGKKDEDKRKNMPASSEGGDEP